MGRMKDIVIRLMNGGDDAVAACHEMMPRWIPIDEQSPAPRVAVEVLVQGDTHADRTVSIGHLDHGEWWSPYFGEPPLDEVLIVKGNVTHWRPLPEPPER